METGKNKPEKNCFGQTRREELHPSSHLLIESEIDQLTFSIIDQKAKQCIGLCSYPIDQSLGDIKRRESIQSLFESNELLKFPFSRRELMVSARECVFVPEEVFKKDEMESYIGSSFENTYSGKVYEQAIPALSNYLVFKIPDWLLTLVDEHLSGAVITHSNALLCDAIYRMSRQQERPLIHAHFKRSFFDLFIFDKGKMLFYNSFAYQTSEDIAYFIMYALKQWNMEGNGLSISGIFNTDADELFWLKKYLGEISEYPVDNLLPYPASIEKPANFINLLNPSFCE